MTDEPDRANEADELLEPTVEMENPFVPAPLGDTIVMEPGWRPQPEDAPRQS